MTYIALIASVLTGMLIVFGFKPGKHSTGLLLSFSGAYLLSVTFLELIPKVYTTATNGIGGYILAGLLLQLVLDFFSKGAEHGHVHLQKESVLPWPLLISLCIHALMEGLPLSGEQAGHEHLLWAVVIHKIPVAIILGSFFVQSGFSKTTAVVFLSIFSLMSPLGSLAGEHLSILGDYSQEINAVVIGVFLHISTIILFESAKEHQFNGYKFLAILSGMLVALLV